MGKEATKEIKMESFQLGQNKVTYKNMLINALHGQALIGGMTFMDAMVKRLAAMRIEDAVATGGDIIKIATGALKIGKEEIPFGNALLRLLNEQVPPSGISFGEMKARLKLMDKIEAATAGETIDLPEAEAKDLAKIMAVVKSTVSSSDGKVADILDQRLAVIEKAEAVKDEDGTLTLTDAEFKDASAAVMSMRWTVMDKGIVKFVEMFEN